MIHTDNINQHYSLDIGYYNKCKRKQIVCGDMFLSRRIREENRTIAVLSDGLGSGIKASVLSTLTATMAVNYTAGFRDVRRTAETIMKTLPVCRERKISYSTFAIIDIDNNGNARIVNYDNPPVVVIRDGKCIDIDETVISGKLKHNRPYSMSFSIVKLQFGDRIILFSDGISQAGIGTAAYPLGWGGINASKCICDALITQPGYSSRMLSNYLVQRALTLDRGEAFDDITCGVIHYRKPQCLLIVTGPPVLTDKDKELAKRINDFKGKKIVCGGTTAKIISRELNREIIFDLKNLHPKMPPCSYMKGIDLVTEGTITLHALAQLLQSGKTYEEIEPSPARDILEYIIDSDEIYFLVGTRINEAWQDPTLPSDIGLRRTIISQIIHKLEEQYQKETKLEFI